MTRKNNLCTDPWIPVTMNNGSSALLCLESLFEQADQIRDLLLSPIERISVMRLLICIAQRALNGPVDVEEKEECMDDIIPKSLIYLHQWRPAFELVGQDGGFLQVAHLTPKSDAALSDMSKLNLSLASGNNPTLFDNAGSDNRDFSFSQKAISLLTYQNFSPGGLVSELSWNKQTTSKSSSGAPCVASSALHMFLLGENLLTSIWMNLPPFTRHAPTQNRVGVPVWENMPDSAQDATAMDNAATSLLGRLVPLSRSIRLMEHGLLLGNGVEYPIYDKDEQLLYWEPTMRLRKTKALS